MLKQIKNWFITPTPLKWVAIYIILISLYPGAFLAMYKYQEWFVTPKYEKYGYVLFTDFLNGCFMLLPEEKQIGNIKFLPGWNSCQRYDSVVKEIEWQEYLKNIKWEAPK